MNYRIKHANQYVISFIIVALALIVSLSILIAIRQKIFEKKTHYFTQLSDGTGLSTQTQLLYKGFEIGRVRSFNLTDEGWINVDLIVYQKYKRLFWIGSVINRMTNPLTGKTQLEFVQNMSSKSLITENGMILSTDNPLGLKMFKELSVGKSSDMITSIVTNLDRIVQEIGKDNNPDKGSLFRFLYHLANVSTEAEQSVKQVNKILNETNQFASNLNKDNNSDQGTVFRILFNAAEASDKINKELKQIDELLKGIIIAVKEYQDPDSLLVKMIDPTGANILNPIKEVIKELDSNLKETRLLLEFMNRQKPEISTMFNQVNSSMDKAQKTLDALNNNPLLKSGIPILNQPSTGTGSRIRELPNE